MKPLVLLACSLLCASTCTLRADVAISVDAALDRHAIDPRIYGVAFASSDQLGLLRAPLNRSGGNSTSGYNWQLNATKVGNDYFFESIPSDSATPGESADTFVQAARSGGSEPMLTIPMLPWIANLGPNRGKLASFSVAKYGAQQKTDQWMPDAGNGQKPDGTKVTGNDPRDAGTPNSPELQAAWVKHLVTKWGRASATANRGGVKYFILDNEPALWSGTHRDVQPVGIKIGELAQKIIATSHAIKAVDPLAQTVAPEEWGWTGFLYSGFDSGLGPSVGWDTSKLPDRKANGGQDAFPALMKLLRASDAQTRSRALDIVTLHYYPQGGEFSDDVSPAMQDRRNRSTRSLWDPNYKDETWIAANVRLIPRLREWANGYRANVPIGITEYNWGAEKHINGATTQADIWGIFGREGVDVAARWTTPPTGSPTFKAMQLMRNADGAGHGFGDTSVRCSAPNSDQVSAFAALRGEDKALTLLLINKQREASEVASVEVKNFAARGITQMWQLTSKNVIGALTTTDGPTGRLRVPLPAQSVTLMVLK